jgi:phage tail sheath protein FI
MPGVVNSTLNTKLVDMCEARGDALAIIDLKGGFIPPEQSTVSADGRKGSVDAVVNTLKTNVINSSYGAAYYPYVQIRDLTNGQTVTVPPSVPAIGALSYSQKVSELWFAPAGFTRGGLSAGRAGLPVIGVKDRLTSRDRDKLYENRINPIAQFPAEGIVIFGQKTLQIQGSALDRINVRRLMIFLKREISRFAATILFDQNVRVTWNRFRGQVEPFLRGVQAGLGITDFKMVLDETTTTPDLVDRNILYAKIYIKPARAIEFIAVDFILTDSGAAFED